MWVKGRVTQALINLRMSSDDLLVSAYNYNIRVKYSCFQTKSGTQTFHIRVSWHVLKYKDKYCLMSLDRGKINLQPNQFSIYSENVRWQTPQRVIRQVPER